MTDKTVIEFTPSEQARGLLQRAFKDESVSSMDEFFALWEAEGCPRRAGSMMAHKFVILGARYAVFGAQCAGVEPNLDLWMNVCREAAERAIADVDESFEQASLTTPEKA